jgi:hypothetical protein
MMGVVLIAGFRGKVCEGSGLEDLGYGVGR